MNLYLKDPKTGEPSVTLTVFISGIVVATSKLLLSGVVIGSLTLAPFTGGDYAACVGSLGAIYVMRRHSSIAGNKTDDV